MSKEKVLLQRQRGTARNEKGVRGMDVIFSDQFKDRLKSIISGGSVNAFAKKCNIPEATLRTYLSGLSLPGLERLIAISEAAQVEIKWLATGEGPKRKRSNSSLPERLKMLRNAVGLSQQKLANQLGISKTAWQGYELGKNELGSGVIKELVNLGFNANWILTGEGEMRLPE